jgi:hypothetical protein
VRGANLSNSNFLGAKLFGADFRGANLSGGCFLGANLKGAKLGSSVNLGGAIFCNTTMPDGRIDNSGCARETPCCHRLQEQDCPDATIACYTTGKDIPMCETLIHRFGPVGHCWRSVGECCPCDHPDQAYWNDLCNQTFPDQCQGACVTWDEVSWWSCFECPSP